MKKFYFTGLVIAIMFPLQSLAFSYSDEHPGDDFFTEGQQWVLRHTSTSAANSTVVNVKVDGDVTIKGKFEVSPGVVTEDNMVCKRLVITPESGEASETGAFEINNKIYVYSSKTAQFEIVADFTASQGEKISIGGTEWNVDHLDYIEAVETLHIRMNLKADGIDVTEVYGIGLSSFIASDQTWNSPGVYTFVSTTVPGSAELTESVFSEVSFVPTNTFYTIGKEWIDNYYNVAQPEDGQLTRYIVSGDVSYANMTCRQIKRTDTDGTQKDFTLGCDHDGKVYILDNGRLKLIMDFNLEVGDFAFPGVEEAEVVQVDKMLVDGKECKRIKFKGAEYDSQMWRYWIETVGSSDGGYMLNGYVAISFRNKMEACLVDGRTIFTYEDFSKSLGLESVIDRDTKSERPVYDIMGREIKHTQPGSIYITNGHKFIGK